MSEITQFSVNSHDYSIERINSNLKRKKMASWHLIQNHPKNHQLTIFANFKGVCVVGRFARNVKCDFFCDFQTSCTLLVFLEMLPLLETASILRNKECCK